MTQELNLPLGPPPRKAHVLRKVRNLRRAYATLFMLVILVFGGWALMDAFRWTSLTNSDRVLTVGFAFLAALAGFVLQLVNYPLRRELRLARRGEIAQAQIVKVGKTPRRRALPIIVYTFRTAGGAEVKSECVLPRRFPVQTLAAGMAIEVLYDPKRPRINKPRMALEFVEFGTLNHGGRGEHGEMPEGE